MISRYTCSVLIIGLASLTSGCFDYEETFHLDSDGSGFFFTKLSYEESNVQEGEPFISFVVASTTKEINRLQCGNKKVLTEYASFSSLDQLSIAAHHYRIKQLPETDRLTLEAVYSITDADITECSGDALAKYLFVLSFLDKSFSVRFEMPGRIISAQRINLKEFEVVPQVSQSQVVYAIPLYPLLTTADQEEITFSMDFESNSSGLVQAESVRSAYPADFKIPAKMSLSVGEIRLPPPIDGE